MNLNLEYTFLVLPSSLPDSHPSPNMDDSIPVTGLQTSGSVSSRFVSQNELDEAKKRKDEEWKAAYAR